MILWACIQLDYGGYVKPSRLKFSRKIQIESFHQNVLMTKQHTMINETRGKSKNNNGEIQ